MALADFFGINIPVVMDCQAAIIGALGRETGRHTAVQMVSLPHIHSRQLTLRAQIIVKYLGSDEF